jgi:hypothetical protein
MGRWPRSSDDYPRFRIAGINVAEKPLLPGLVLVSGRLSTRRYPWLLLLSRDAIETELQSLDKDFVEPRPVRNGTGLGIT